MIKKIIHLADIHIRTLKYHDVYKEVFNNLFKDIKKRFKGYPSDEVRIVIAGDLLHQKTNISNEQMVLAAKFLKLCADMFKTIIVAGNHDLLENNKDRMDSITPIIEILSHPNISYLKDSKCYEDENIVWCNYSIFENNSAPNITEYRLTNTNKDVKYIGLFHAPLIGSQTSIGYTIEHGATTEHFKGCDLVLLGDIHKLQEFSFEDGNKKVKLKYPSSLIQQNFGETINEHGYLIWDIETLTDEFIEVANENLFYDFDLHNVNDIENYLTLKNE